MPSAFLSAGGSVLSSTPGGAIGEPLSATYSVVPSGLNRMPRGRLPTGIVAIVFAAATSTTVMSPLVSLVTNRRPAAGGADAGAGAADSAGCDSREHAAAQKRRAMPTMKRFGMARIDRKSTRLNSSHLVISYAVFCLKKKKLAVE